MAKKRGISIRKKKPIRMIDDMISCLESEGLAVDRVVLSVMDRDVLKDVNTDAYGCSFKYSIDQPFGWATIYSDIEMAFRPESVWIGEGIYDAPRTISKKHEELWNKVLDRLNRNKP